MVTTHKSLGIDIGSVSVKLVLMDEGKAATPAEARMAGLMESRIRIRSLLGTIQRRAAAEQIIHQITHIRNIYPILSVNVGCISRAGRRTASKEIID